MGSSKNPLQKQLEQQRFLHGIQYVSQSSRSLKKLNSSELLQLNQLITGQSGQNDKAWRLLPTEIQIPSGKKIQLSLVNNPLNRAREIIGTATESAGNQRVFEAASYLYSQLVLEHLFNDANRRTAVLATLWLLQEHGVDMDAEKLHQIPIGDLRDPQNLNGLADRIRELKG